MKLLRFKNHNYLCIRKLLRYENRNYFLRKLLCVTIYCYGYKTVTIVSKTIGIKLLRFFVVLLRFLTTCSVVGYLTIPKFRVALIFAQKRCAKIKPTIFAQEGCAKIKTREIPFWGVGEN